MCRRCGHLFSAIVALDAVSCEPKPDEFHTGRVRSTAVIVDVSPTPITDVLVVSDSILGKSVRLPAVPSVEPPPER